jgi:hypothetical protein
MCEMDGHWEDFDPAEALGYAKSSLVAVATSHLPPRSYITSSRLEYSLNIRLILASTLIGLSLVACNGGGSTPNPLGTTVTPSPSASPLATATPTATPTASPGTTTAQSAVTVTTGGVLSPSLSATDLAGLGLASGTQPTISGLSGLTLPSTLPAVTYSNVLPNSVSTFGRRKLSTTVPGATALIYTSFTAPAITVPIGTSLTFSYPFATAPAADTQFNMAFFDGTTWTADTANVGVVSGSTVTVTTTALTSAYNLVSGTTYAAVLYSSVSTASPTPTPSATPTALPTFTPIAGTASVSSHHPDSTSLTIDGNAGSVVLPQASASGSLAYSISPMAPNGVTALSGAGVTSVWGYATVTPGSDITFSSGATATASLSAPAIPSGSYALAYSSDGTNWITGIGSSSVSGSTLTLTVTNTADTTLSNGTSYYVALYQ